MESANKLEVLTVVTQQTITLMGISFIVGSLFTIFILLILDMLRQMNQKSADTDDIQEE